MKANDSTPETPFSKTDLRRDGLAASRRRAARIVAIDEIEEADDILFNVEEELEYVETTEKNPLEQR